MNQTPEEMIKALRHEAAVMDQRWGRNPTSELLREVSLYLEGNATDDAIVEDEPAPKPAPKKRGRPAKKTQGDTE